MEFSFTTTYDLPALTCMARALRKTVRKKHSRRSRIYAAVVMALGAVVLIFWRRHCAQGSDGGRACRNGAYTDF